MRPLSVQDRPIGAGCIYEERLDQLLRTLRRDLAPATARGAAIDEAVVLIDRTCAELRRLGAGHGR